MNEYEIVYKSSVKSGEAMAEIHRVNCRDLSKKENHKRLSSLSPKSLIEKELKGELTELGYTKKDFRIMDCIHD